MATPTVLMTQWTPLRKARSVNQTSNGYVSKVWTTTEPVTDAATATGQATLNMRNGNSATQNKLMILPYAIGSDNNTFSMRVIGWRCFGTDPTTLIWGPILLLEVLCTLDSTLVGVTGSLILVTEMFCDTITLVGTSGNANISHELLNPADGVSTAHVMVDTKGCDKIECSFTTGASATSCNALIAQL